MPVYKVELLGRKFNVSAPSIGEAQGMARLYVARKQMEEGSTAQAMQSREGLSDRVLGAVDTGEAPADAAPSFMESVGRNTTFGTAPTPDEARKEWEENIPAFAATAAATSLTAPAMIANPLAAAKAIGWGMAGSVGGAEIGKFVGGLAEDVGLPKGTRRVLTTGGGLVGGMVGPFKGPAMLQAAAKLSPHSRLGMLARAVMGQEPAAVAAGTVPVAVASKAAPVAVVADEAEVLAGQLAQQLRVPMDVAKEMVRRGLAAEAASARTVAAEPAVNPVIAAARAAREAKAAEMVAAARSAPATRGATALASETATQPVAVSQAEEIAAKILQWKNVNKFSGAQMESALRNLYKISPKDGRKMIAAVLEAQGPSPLQAPRIQVGAQKVGRSVGMTKEEVRQAAGPVLNEARGEASPVLPKQALQSIIDTMRALPKTGGYREAYVARATSGKTMAQVENIRRTLEHLGLLLPVGVAAGVAASEKG